VTSSFAPSRGRCGDVTVLIVGQDPYPTPGHPIGLSFAVDAHVRPLPRSLQNIYRELADDLGISPAPHGDLSAWSDQGVMLSTACSRSPPGRRHPTADGGGRR
jgi:uracil-DNA glycosylase